MSNDTIYALSTVAGKSGVAVFRVSGDAAFAAVSQLTKLAAEKIVPRRAYYAAVYDSAGLHLDNALILCFKAPSSFTGEDTVEFHTHGSRAVIESMLDSLGKISGFRLAEPGEFSRRAFYNGKMDLTEAEGLADLIDAETREQQKYALRQMGGELKNLYDGWREKLVNILAYLEAYIDFPDEDLPAGLTAELEAKAADVLAEIEKHLKQSEYGEHLHEGFRAVIVGEPNAGKSSLLNTLARREAVIVSDIAGTTRDAIDIYMDLNGYPVIFTDTAGLRTTDEQIEKKGIEIAYDKAEKADLIIALVDGENVDFSPFENLVTKCKNKIIFVINKKDKLSAERCSQLVGDGYIVISAKYREGMEDLFAEINSRLAEGFTDASGALITRRRYREVLQNVCFSLESFSLAKPIELAAEDIRLAAREIGKITGRVEVNEILDKIFGSFCIGK